MSSRSQTISKERLFIMATFPFPASDCNSFPLYFQLACNYTNSWYIYYSSHNKGNRRAKSGKWGGNFLRQFCCWWNGVFLSAAQLLSDSCNHLLLTTFKPFCTFSCTDPAVFRLCSSCMGWRQPFSAGSFFKIDYWLCLQGKVISPMCHCISKAVLLVILLSRLRPKYTVPVKVTLDMSLPVYEVLPMQIYLSENALHNFYYQYNYVSRSVCGGLSI